MKFIAYLLLLILPALPFDSAAQKGAIAREDKALVQCIRHLKTMEGYHYRTAVQSSFAGDTQQKKPVFMDNYQSLERFVLYSRSEGSLFFLCRKGQFRVDEESKTVYYKVFANDSMLADARYSYMELPALSLDSLFLSNGLITRKNISKKNISFQVSYPAGATIQQLSLDADPVSLVPSRVRYTMERQMSQHYQGGQVLQQVVMDQYRKATPAAVRQLEAAIQDLYHYLQQQYPGYTLKNI